MTKFMDNSFSSRPASQEYRDNYDRTFGKAAAEESNVNVVESTRAVQFTKPSHDDKCNCRLCRTARRAEGK